MCESIAVVVHNQCLTAVGLLLLGNRLTTLAMTMGLGSTIGGLEFMSGRFGSSLVTLLLTERFASGLLIFSVKISLRNSSWSIALRYLFCGPHFIGRTIGALGLLCG